MTDAATSVAQQLLATQARLRAMERRVHELTAENQALRADLSRLQQNRPPMTQAGLDAMWKGTA